MFEYLNDGANYQAKAVLMYLDGYDGIKESWNSEWKRYQADPHVSRWENCREQGYVVWMKSKNHSRQINIAFFEHRNSDSICAVKWEQNTINAPTIETAKFGDVYKDKYDVSHSVKYGESEKMSSWIFEQMVDFWKESK